MNREYVEMACLLQRTLTEEQFLKLQELLDADADHEWRQMKPELFICVDAVISPPKALKDGTATLTKIK